MELGALPEGWLATTLGEVASWSSGGTPSRSRPEYFRGNIPWIKSGELGAKYIRGTEERISEAAIAQSSAKVFPQGAVGIAMYGATIGKLSIWGIDASTNQACAVGVCGEALNNEFLYYFLASEKRNLIKAGKGGAQPNISQGIIKEWPLNLPPLAEQHRIVAKIEELFSELDQGVASLKTAREQLKVYRQSLLKNAFEGKLTAAWRAAHADQLETAAALQQRIAREREARYQQQLADWQSQGKSGPKPKAPKPLPPLAPEELAELPELPAGWGWVSIEWLLSIDRKPMATGPFGTLLSKADHRPTGLPVLGIENIGNGVFSRGNKIFVSEEKAKELEPFRVAAGDVVISRSGTVGEICKIPEGLGKAFISTNLIRVTLNRSVISEDFFVYLFQGGGSVKQQVKSLCKGSSREFLNQGILSAIAFPLPCIQEQREIVSVLEEKLSEADQLDQTLATALQQAEALRQSILKKAFCGQLVEQDQNDEPATALLERIRAAQGTAKTSLGVRGRKPKSNVQNLHIAFNDPEIPGSSFAGHQE